MIDAEFGAKFSKVDVVELPAVVRYKDAGESKSADYKFSNKVPHLLLGDPSHRFSFDPLGEVVDGDNQKFSLSGGQGEGPQNINSPLGEWPGYDN